MIPIPAPSAFLPRWSHLTAVLGSPWTLQHSEHSISTFQRCSSGCCCLGAPTALPPQLDRLMAALCEPTRWWPCTAPSWLLNHHHPDKTRGDTLSWDQRARQGCTGDPEHPPSPGCQSGDAAGSAGLPGGPGAPSPVCQARQSHPPAPRHCAALIPGFHTFSTAGPQPPPQTKPTLMRQHQILIPKSPALRGRLALVSLKVI